MDEKLNRESQEPPPFGGKPGEAVPTVDPEDAKTVWQIMKDADAGHPGKNVGVGFDLVRRACGPGTNIESVGYRAGFLWMMSYIAPEDPRFTRDRQPDEAVFRAAAMVPAVWMGVGIVREGPPFDVKEYLRLCGEENQVA
jgi:hypothetical protein